MEYKKINSIDVGEITSIVHNTMDFCGNWMPEIRDYCLENKIDIDNPRINAIITDAFMSYGY